MSGKFRFVFRRRVGVAALIGVTLVAAGLAATIAVTSAKAVALDSCGYDPTAAPKPGGGTAVFNENEVTRAIAVYGVGFAAHVGVFANDESGLNIGAGGTATSTGLVGQLGSALANNTTITSISVAPPGLQQTVAIGDNVILGNQNFKATAAGAVGDSSITVQSQKTNSAYPAGTNISVQDGPQGAVPPTLGTGADADGRFIAPVIYLTDITANAAATGGDWEQGGTAASLSGGTPFADGLFGSWSNVIGTSPSNKNNWNLGNGSDPLPTNDVNGNPLLADNQGFGTETTWNVAGLKAFDPATNSLVALQPGHTYRAQSLTHDSDQNKGSGDVGEVCTTFHIPTPNLVVSKTADHTSPVNAGDQIGFTVEVKNTGDADAVGASIGDVLPTGSGSGVTWAIASDPSNAFQLGTNGAGKQVLELKSSTLLQGADYLVHITAQTSKTECSVYDNSATVSATNAPSAGPATAEESCNPADIKILKKADKAKVNAGDDIGFTVTVWNAGAGDAYGTALNDPLPQNAGVSWSIDAQGNGWNNTCSINPAGTTLSCGPVTVPKNTAQIGSPYTVHITSHTTKDTAGDCQTTGIVDNTGFVTTTNDGSGQSEDTVCVQAADIKIFKKADAAKVSAGDDIGFTVTVWNAGAGDAYGAALNDPLPQNAGVSWSIDAQGAGWNNSCSINPAGTTLSCGPVTVPTGTTQLNSTFTVHITSHTTKDTAGDCQTTGIVDNTGFVTTTNDGSGQSEDTVCVQPADIQILKKADNAKVSAGDDIGFTVTLWNAGAGDAKGAELNDPLPQNAGLSWSIDAQGTDWNNTCSINPAGTTLHCGPATVPAGTTQLNSKFTVHITSHTTKDTAGDCPGSGEVDNTGTVTTTNDGSGQSSDSVCVQPADIKFLKKADAAQVNAGDDIGFTQTTWNDGAGDAKGVMLNDPLPTNAGLSWSIDAQGSGWNNTCAIVGTTLSCGPVTVPAGTTQAASTFTVHITSPTTVDTGGNCPTTGVVNNTGTVTTTNDGGGSSSDSVCVQNSVDLSVTKSGSPAAQELGQGNITWTMVVTNNGPATDTDVKISDPMPAGNTYVSSTTSQGTCTGGAILNCSLGTMAAGASVTITLVTTPSTVGLQTNTVTVVGDLPETNTANNTATATVRTTGVPKPPTFCVAVSRITPKQLFVGRKTMLTIHVTKQGKAIAGIKVHIKGPKLNTVTTRSNGKGVIHKTVKMKKAGILVFSPIASKRCNTKRIGITGVFTPPVTG